MAGISGTMKILVTNKYQNPIHGTNKGVRFGPKLYTSVLVPDVIGMTEANATAANAAVGLLTQVTNIEPGWDDQVVLQNPVAGTSVVPGSLVSIRMLATHAFSSGFTRGYR